MFSPVSDKFLPLGSHVYYMSGDAWKEGGIDATGKKNLLSLFFQVAGF